MFASRHPSFLTELALPLVSAVAASSATAETLDAARRACAPESSPRTGVVAHLQLDWADCDYAQIPLNPLWRGATGAASPTSKSPSTTGKECQSFPYSNGALHLPAGCIFPPPSANVPSGGIHEFSCNRLRYLPSLSKFFHPDPILYGHANLNVVAMAAKVRFLEQANPDQDYNFALLAGDAGLPTTDQNASFEGRPSVVLEFFAPESIEAFQVPWWRDLHQRVLSGWLEKPRWQTARSYVGEVDSYAVGLFGLDCEHGCASELHPIYALALRSIAPRPPSEPTGDRWAFFARNSGSEGFCSDGSMVDLDLEYVALVLPPPTGTPNGYDLLGADVRRHPANGSVAWTVFPVAEGAVVLIHFPPRDDRYQLIEGEVVFRWR